MISGIPKGRQALMFFIQLVSPLICICITIRFHLLRRETRPYIFPFRRTSRNGQSFYAFMTLSPLLIFPLLLLPQSLLMAPVPPCTRIWGTSPVAEF
ncbi:uncharacterized protein F5147DRAFT_291325 [Suillus discolor]|uniref:Uncharacterized protein n=1 Tax=Suillus discolor TaxID=1912936 RepID=A0A9P7F2W9_9AGAM|nr:uncharacterized protein F5147DRAFT_291325 [Suillus discolor]KAG2102193.1 hypothetical protein F5147DRAFT_291325 [Suillus discolor]